MEAAPDLTEDGFLGGRLRIRQPRAGYRAGVDPVLLAAAVPAHPGESVLELGLGTGTASLCLGARVPGLRLTGIEVQAGYAALARENAAANGIALEVVEGDVRRVPEIVRARSFDHVITNPPYYPRAGRTPATDLGRERALGEDLPLADWIGAVIRRLKPGGRLTVIQRAERTADLLAACTGLGSIELWPLAPREGRAAALVILGARKGGRAAFRLHSPVILHAGARHLADGDDYRPEIRKVLREGAALFT